MTYVIPGRGVNVKLANVKSGGVKSPEKTDPVVNGPLDEESVPKLGP